MKDANGNFVDIGEITFSFKNDDTRSGGIPPIGKTVRIVVGHELDGRNYCHAEGDPNGVRGHGDNATSAIFDYMRTLDWA